MRIILGNPPITKDRQADVVSYPNLGILSLILGVMAATFVVGDRVIRFERYEISM